MDALNDRHRPESTRRRRPVDTGSAYAANPDRNTPLADTRLPLRVTNVLEAQEIFCLGDLADTPVERLEAIKSFGEKTLKDIRKLLVDAGLCKTPTAKLRSKPKRPRPAPSKAKPKDQAKPASKQRKKAAG